jgi:hypothetical protein
LPHHAKFGTGAFFCCLGARAQIINFSEQGNVSRTQAIVNGTLRSDILLHVPDGQPTTPTHPQGILDQTSQRN